MARRLAATAIALCIVLPVVGRWERDRAGNRAVEGIAAVRALVGSPLAGDAEAYLRAGRLTCLFYTRSPRRFGVSLCYDDKGRLVEATDGRDGEPALWTIRMDRELARERADPQQIQAIVDALSLRALFSAVRATVLFETSQNCLLHLNVLLEGHPRPKLRARVGVALAECRQARPRVLTLGPNHLRSAPRVARALHAYVDILGDTIARLETLKAALARGGGFAAELHGIEVLKASLPSRLERAGVSLERAIEAEA